MCVRACIVCVCVCILCGVCVHIVCVFVCVHIVWCVCILCVCLCVCILCGVCAYCVWCVRACILCVCVCGVCVCVCILCGVCVYVCMHMNEPLNIAAHNTSPISPSLNLCQRVDAITRGRRKGKVKGEEKHRCHLQEEGHLCVSVPYCGQLDLSYTERQRSLSLTVYQTYVSTFFGILFCNVKWIYEVFRN